MVNLKQKWLFLFGIALDVVSISILLLLKFSAPDMGEKYYIDLTSVEKQVFWVAGMLMVVAVICNAVYWGKEWGQSK